MKSNRDFRQNDNNESMRRAAKLEPMRKSGKEKHSMFNSNADDDVDDDYFKPQKRESVFDYMDDDEE